MKRIWHSLLSTFKKCTNLTTTTVRTSIILQEQTEDTTPGRINNDKSVRENLEIKGTMTVDGLRGNREDDDVQKMYEQGVSLQLSIADWLEDTDVKR
ncbi:hypothetical protein Tco_0842678 [Tanacetum coccineum]|uniref:Uncharacterized protein n=1 Tax=Tanacetum coccineum TaxID=301880 RepID=A0ABQ5B0U9_9ASTR